MKVGSLLNTDIRGRQRYFKSRTDRPKLTEPTSVDRGQFSLFEKPIVGRSVAQSRPKSTDRLIYIFFIKKNHKPPSRKSTPFSSSISFFPLKQKREFSFDYLRIKKGKEKRDILGKEKKFSFWCNF